MMSKGHVGNEVTIPVSSVFDTKLAELVWLNCPELARQTVAGKIAMSLEIDDEHAHAVMQHEIKVVVSAFVKEKASELKEQVNAQIDEVLKAEVTKALRVAVKQVMDSCPVAKEVGNIIRAAVNDEATVLVNAWVNKNLESRVDKYLDDHVPAIALKLAENSTE